MAVPSDSRVIDIRASTSRWDAPVSWTVEVHPLAGVSRVEVSAAADPWDETPGAEWPGLVRAAVTFTGGWRIELRPQGPDEEHPAELYALAGCCSPPRPAGRRFRETAPPRVVAKRQECAPEWPNAAGPVAASLRSARPISSSIDAGTTVAMSREGRPEPSGPSSRGCPVAGPAREMRPATVQSCSSGPEER